MWSQDMSLLDRLSAKLSKGIESENKYLRGDDFPWIDSVTPAAVLLAITDRADPGLILTQRPDYMRRHAGQIAFPGGRVDESDGDAVAAALREAQEEIALNPAQVSVLGALDDYKTGSGFLITPVIGLVPPDLPLRPCANEVAEIFEVPLAFVLDPVNQQRKTGEWKGVAREYYQIQWQDRRIWGATASILVNLARRLA